MRLAILLLSGVIAVISSRDSSHQDTDLLEHEGMRLLNTADEVKTSKVYTTKPTIPQWNEKRQRLRHERRQERQERREERRKYRNRLNGSKIPVKGNYDSDDDFSSVSLGPNSHFDQPNNLGGVIFPYVGENQNGGDEDKKIKNEYVTDFRWLGSNLSAIWEILYQMQNEMKQMRRLYRVMHDSKKNGRRDHSSHEVTYSPAVEEDCDPQFDVNPANCLSKTGTVCGGNGRCDCGQCVCNTPFYGVLCQCNDFNCHYTGGVMCGGPDKGQCRCGSCVCRSGYTGRDCECSTGTSECEAPPIGIICSGKGECVCNRCQCQDGHNGKYCEEYIYSATKCESLKLCVLCQAFGKKYPQCEDCNVEVFMVSELESSRATCIMIHLNCILKYAYVLPTKKEDKTMVLVQQGDTKSC